MFVKTVKLLYVYISVVLSDECLLDIAKNLGRSWTEVGIRLGMDKTELDNIESESRSVSQKAFDMLIKWNQQADGSKEVKVAQLTSALLKEGRRDVVRLLDDYKTKSKACNIL